MYAIEFETNAKGRMIEIPQEYEALASKHLKVIVMLDELEPTDLPKVTNASTKLAQEQAIENELFFNILKSRHNPIEKTTNIDQIMQEMNDGLR